MRRPAPPNISLAAALALAAVSLLLVFAPATARAAPPTHVETAAESFDALVKKANKAFASKDYDRALKLFEKAYALDAVPNLLYNLARVHEAKGDFPPAIDAYKRFIASPGVDHKARTDAIERMKTLLEVVELTGGGGPSTNGGDPPPNGGGDGDSGGGVNINTASEGELQTLKGIGPSKARAIVTDRQKNGPFSSVDDLTRVRGIGAKTLEKLRPYITVGGGGGGGGGGATPPDDGGGAAPPDDGGGAAPPDDGGGGGININTAGEAELTQLTGIGPSKARAIITERDKNGPFASCQDLTRVRGIGAGTVGKLVSDCRVK